MQSRRYGKFSDMDRGEVQGYLESEGFAVYDDEPIDRLRDAAYQHWSIDQELYGEE